MLLVASLIGNFMLYREARYFADRALAEQSLRRAEQAEYLQFVEDTREQLNNIRATKKAHDDLLLQHEQKRSVPQP